MSARRGAMRLSGWALTLLAIGLVVALGFGLRAWRRHRENVRLETSRQGARQAIEQARAAAAATLPPLGWRRETRTVQVAMPLGGDAAEITYFTNTIGMEFALVPAGEFTMGGRVGHYAWRAAHRVRITRPFFMAAHEVTQGRYEHIMGINPSHFKGSRDLPVEKVSWNEAMEFCRRLAEREGLEYRLPTEAEWEYACRAGTTTSYYTGRQITTDQANSNGYGLGPDAVDRKRTTAVGSFPANPFGLFDMSGNVWEWCADWYSDTYYERSPRDDPPGPARGTRRVMRGGGWDYIPAYCTSHIRARNNPGSRQNIIGFRVVVPAAATDQ